MFLSESERHRGREREGGRERERGREWLNLMLKRKTAFATTSLPPLQVCKYSAYTGILGDISVINKKQKKKILA